MAPDGDDLNDDSDEGDTPGGPMLETQSVVGESPEYRTLAHGHLSPRHRRLCFLAAQGKSNQEIGQELGYADSRVSILLKNPYIVDEVTRLQERIFEETIGARLKSFAEPALANIQMILTDRTNRVKISEKMALSQWVIEKLDGKATQKIEAGENLLASLMDRLDAGRTSQRPVVNVNIVNSPTQPAEIDVTREPVKQIEGAKSDEDLVDAWFLEEDAVSQQK